MAYRPLSDHSNEVPDEESARYDEPASRYDEPGLRYDERALPQGAAWLRRGEPVPRRPGQALPSNLTIDAGWRYTPGLLGALALAVLGLVVGVVPGTGTSVFGRTVAILDFLSFSFVAFLAALVALREAPTYLLAADGIRFPKQHWPTIPWRHVAGARIVSVGGQPHLAIDLIDADAADPGGGRVGQRVLQLNQRRGWGFLTIPETASPVDLDDLGAEVIRRAQAAGAGAGAEPLGKMHVGRRLLVAAELPEVAVLAHALLEVLLVAKPQAAGVPAAPAAVLLLVSGFLLRYRPKVGVPLAVALESAFIALALTLGHHVGMPSRVVAVLFPLCVLAIVGTQSAQR